MERPKTPGPLMIACQSKELHHYKQPNLYLSYASRNNIVLDETPLGYPSRHASNHTVHEPKKDRSRQETSEKKADESVKTILANWYEDRAHLDSEIQRKVESSLYIRPTSAPALHRAETERLHLRSPYTELRLHNGNLDAQAQESSPGLYDMAMARKEQTVSNQRNFQHIGIKEQENGEYEKLKQNINQKGIACPTFLERAMKSPQPRSTEECRKSLLAAPKDKQVEKIHKPLTKRPSTAPHLRKK